MLVNERLCRVDISVSGLVEECNEFEGCSSINDKMELRSSTGRDSIFVTVILWRQPQVKPRTFELQLSDISILQVGFEIGVDRCQCSALPNDSRCRISAKRPARISLTHHVKCM